MINKACNRDDHAVRLYHSSSVPKEGKGCICCTQPSDSWLSTTVKMAKVFSSTSHRLIHDFAVISPTGHLYKPHGAIIVDCHNQTLSLPKRMKEAMLEDGTCAGVSPSTCIAGSSLRYVTLTSRNNAFNSSIQRHVRRDEKEPGHRDGTVLLLSYMCQCSPLSDHIANLFLMFDGYVSARFAYLTLNRVIYITSGRSRSKIDTLQPYFSACGKVNVITPLDAQSEAKMVKTPMFLMLDEQALALYIKPFQVKPTYYMAFHKESSGKSVISAHLVDGADRRLEIKAEHEHLVLLPASDEEHSKVKTIFFPISKPKRLFLSHGFHREGVHQMSKESSVAFTREYIVTEKQPPCQRFFEITILYCLSS